MKRILSIFIICSAFASADPKTRMVVLTWQDTQNPAGTTYSVYRAPSDCATNPSFTSMATGVKALTWTDLAVPPGKYCYYVTPNYATLESDASNSATVLVRPFAVVITAQTP